MVKINKLTLTALFTFFSTLVFADDSFSWNGYYRAGLGMDEELVNKNKSDGEVNSLGRFGLEYDDFVAGVFSKKWSDDKEQWAKFNFAFNTFDYTSTNNNPLNSSGGKINTLNASDTYVEMGGLTFLPKDSSIWVGKRRTTNGIDLLDLNYRKFNGHGIGYSSKNFDLAFYKELNSGDMGEGADVIAVDSILKTGNIKLEGTFTKSTTDTSSTYNGNKKGDTSVSLLAEYKNKKFIGLSSGNTTYRLQVGKGVTSNKLSMSVITDEKDEAYRLTIDGNTMKKNWLFNTVINYESSKVDSKDITYTTLTFIGKGTQKINENISMIYEAGVAEKENINLSGTINKNNDGLTYKIAAGPAIQMNSMPWIRPIIRTTVAIVGGDKEVTGFKENTEIRLGAQFETYF
ncbi:MAG: carbohydrate porin [Fusobacteriaceae bacterium]|nr:carbohydrate porin [Fusobacteriaceae bacterium]